MESAGVSCRLLQVRQRAAGAVAQGPAGVIGLACDALVGELWGIGVAMVLQGANGQAVIVGDLQRRGPACRGKRCGYSWWGAPVNARQFAGRGLNRGGVFSGDF